MDVDPRLAPGARLPVVPDAPDSLPSEVLSAIDGRWQFAKTMARWPHFYLQQAWDRDRYEVLGRAIMDFGYTDVFQGVPSRYLEWDGWKYWVYGRGINRERVDPAERVVPVEYQSGMLPGREDPHAAYSPRPEH